VPLAERATVTEGLQQASTSAFHFGIGLGALLVFSGGAISLVGIRNPQRKVQSAECAGGALVGASQDLARGLAVVDGTAQAPSNAMARSS
jgi:hypothetical protein